MTNMSAREDAEQATLFSWAAMQSGKYPELRLLFHIPNGGKRSAAEAARFKAEGVRAGVPDLMLPVPRQGKHGLWIEMKRREGGRLSDHQAEWLKELEEQGYRCEVCCGWEEAREVLIDYLTRQPLSQPEADSSHCTREPVNTSSVAAATPSPQGEGKGQPNKKKARGKRFDVDAWLEAL